MRGLWATRGQTRDRHDAGPRLSVVVPVYQVEAFLAACLDSLLAQTYEDFEAILVIDGATDRSPEIADEYAAADSRIRVIRQQNAGLSAARNTGVRAARGAYLAFLDSDDRLPPQAYTLMMETIERTGSDLVAGTLTREPGHRRKAMRLMRENHRVRRERTTLREMPLMLADVFAVNKVYRRSFWDEAGLAFPENLRYEDQPTLTSAFLAARRFDVIPELVYLWRVRPDQTSITQRRHELEDLVDRVQSKRIGTELVQASETPALLDIWFRDILPVDMWEYFRAVPEASEDYWETLRSAVHEFWNETTVPFDRTRVAVQQRLMGWLVDRGRRDELTRLIAYLDEHHGDVPVELRGDHVVAHLPGVDDPGAGLPESTYTLDEHELRWECKATASAWSGGRLHLEGFALIRNVPTGNGATTKLSGALVSADDPGTRWPLVVRREVEPRATHFAGRPRQDFDACGFSTTVDVPALLAADRRSDRWRFVLRREVDRLERAGGVTHLDEPRLDLEWQDVPDAEGRAARVRLGRRDGELVLERRPSGGPA